MSSFPQEPDTGDILLFRGTQVFSKLLECFGRSKYSHVGMILRNPRFLRPDLEDGLYVLESSSNDIPEVEDHTHHLGVQIHRLEDVIRSYPEGSVFIRHVTCERNDTFYETLRAVHEEVHHKPYDLNPVDWIRAEWNLIHPLEIHPVYQKTDAFWCSALLCYLYGRLDLLETEMDWSLIAPREFSAEEGTLLRFRCPVGPEEPFVLPCPSPSPSSFSSPSSSLSSSPSSSPSPSSTETVTATVPLVKIDPTSADHSQ